MERVTWKHPLPVNRYSQREFALRLREFKPGLYNNLEGWDGVGGRFMKEETYVHLWLIHVDVWQKPTKFCKTIILQLKNKFKIKKKTQYYKSTIFQ